MDGPATRRRSRRSGVMCSALRRVGCRRPILRRGERQMIYVHRATFDEMDYAQVTFFGRHFYWLEHALCAWLVEKDMGFAVLSGQHNLGLPVISAECKYRAPVNMDQVIEVRMAVRELNRKGFTTPFE